MKRKETEREGERAHVFSINNIKKRNYVEEKWTFNQGSRKLEDF